MRFVIYDDESLEPITVLNLPITERDALQQRVWRVPVPPETFSILEGAASHELQEPKIVTLEFEHYRRESPRHGRQDGVFCFTRATELAMLLNPAWLPGQRRAVDYLQEQNDALTRMLMASWAAY